MDSNITLQQIFSFIIDKENFLCKVIEPKSNSSKDPKIVDNSITKTHSTLSPYETCEWKLLPKNVKTYLPKNYVRYGIKGDIQKLRKNVNISFLNSINMLLRPDLLNASLSEQEFNFNLFEDFISHKIHRNAYRIDKMTNFENIKILNRKVVEELQKGKINDDIIQMVVNIFEFNLVIFDIVTSEMYFFWAAGHKFHCTNLFNKLYFLIRIGENYEPLLPTASDEGNVDNCCEEDIQKSYLKILSRIEEFKTFTPVVLKLHNLQQIHTWNCDGPTYVKIVKKYFDFLL